MRLLFDDNISCRIVEKVAEVFPGCQHLNRTGLSAPAPDKAIWEYSQKYDYVIVTFDDDFEDLHTLHGFPPKVIILRLGNTATQAIADTLIRKKMDMTTFYLSEVYGLLELY